MREKSGLQESPWLRVLTLNRLDFIRLHRETQGTHPGITVCTRDDADPPAAFARRIHATMADAGDPVGQLIRVVRPSSWKEFAVVGAILVSRN